MLRAPWRCLCAALVVALCAAPVQADDDPGLIYRFDLVLDQDEEVLQGEGTLRFRNDGSEPLAWVPLVLYPNRFLNEDPGLNDVNYDRFYAPWFDEGSLELMWVESGGQALRLERPHVEGLAEGVYVQVHLPAPVAPGDWAELSLAFTLDVPDRLGTFGVRHERFVLEGGALPYVPSAGPDGQRDPRYPPEGARYDLDLQVRWDDPDEPEGILLHDALMEERLADGRARIDTPSPLIVVGDDLVELAQRKPDETGAGVRVFGEEGDEERAQRLLEITRDVGLWARRYLDPDAPLMTVTWVEAPLRDRFVHATDGAVLYSERLFHLFTLLQGFHELEAARGAVQSIVRQALADAPLGPDRDWVCEGFAWVILQDWLQTRGGLTGEDVRGGLRWLDVIPVVDRLLRAPKFPGADLYYGRIHETWVDVPDEFARALWRRQRGRVPLEKLRDRLGTEGLHALVRDSLAAGALAEQSFRSRAEQALEAPSDPFFSLWLELPSPKQNLAFEELETIEVLPDGSERIRVKIRREGEDAERVGEVGEPVAVGSEDAEGEPVRAVWNGRGLEGNVELVYSGGWFTKVTLDPDGRADQWRGDDERPRFAKLLINRLRIRIDLNRGNRNEVAVGFTLVPGYDYRHAITVDTFLEEDEKGVTLAYSYGFGWSIDERSYGVGLGVSFNGSDADQGVLKGDTLSETEGQLLSVGASVGFDTRIDRLNPTWGFGLNLGFEYSDKVLGADFRYLTVSGSASVSYSLWRGTQLNAQIKLGQSEATDVPSQRLFDAGGQGTIRGVRTSRFVDTALVAIRTEFRQMLIEDLDIPLVWFVWLRKIQLVAYVDTGDVGKRLDTIFVPKRDWKWGAGGGLRFHLDGLGVSRFVLGFSVAVRLDGGSDVDRDPQFYFGGGQSF